MLFNALSIVSFIFSCISIKIAINYYNRTKPNLIVKLANQSYYYKDNNKYFAHIFLSVTNDCSIADSILTINFLTGDPESNNSLYLLPDFSYLGKQYNYNAEAVSKKELIVPSSFTELSFPLKMEAYETINISLCVPNWELIKDAPFFLHISTSRINKANYNNSLTLDQIDFK